MYIKKLIEIQKQPSVERLRTLQITKYLFEKCRKYICEMWRGYIASELQCVNEKF